MRIRSTAAVPVVVTAVLVAACTTSASSHTAAGGPSATAATPTRMTTATSCSAPATSLTYRKREVVIATYNLTLPPNSSATTPRQLSPRTVIVARAQGLGTGSGLIASVSRHWHTRAAPLGASTRSLDPDVGVTVPNHGSTNSSFVVYRAAPELTGTYRRACGGAAVHGTYTTFGPIRSLITNCVGGHPSALDRQARRATCS